MCMYAFYHSYSINCTLYLNSAIYLADFLTCLVSNQLHSHHRVQPLVEQRGNTLINPPKLQGGEHTHWFLGVVVATVQWWRSTLSLFLTLHVSHFCYFLLLWSKSCNRTREVSIE